jgi:hypothetical protein
METLLDLRSVLIWCISGGGGGVIAWWLIPRVPWMAALAYEHKRWCAMILAGFVGVLATCASVIAFEDSAPADWRGWGIKLVAVFMTAAVAGQLAHSREVTVQAKKSSAAGAKRLDDCDCEGTCTCPK